MDLNAIRARKKMPPLVLCLESHLFQTYPRFTYFSTIFRDQYLPLTAVTANRKYLYISILFLLLISLSR